MIYAIHPVGKLTVTPEGAYLHFHAEAPQAAGLYRRHREHTQHKLSPVGNGVAFASGNRRGETQASAIDNHIASSKAETVGHIVKTVRQRLLQQRQQTTVDSAATDKRFERCFHNAKLCLIFQSCKSPHKIISSQRPHSGRMHHRHRRKTAEERIAPSAQYTAIGEKPPKSGLIR